MGAKFINDTEKEREEFLKGLKTAAAYWKLIEMMQNTRTHNEATGRYVQNSTEACRLASIKQWNE